MLNNEDTKLSRLDSANILHKQGANLQINAKVSNNLSVQKREREKFAKTYNTYAALESKG